MLTKLTNQVFVASKPAIDYRPYSKTCPAPAPPAHINRWVLKTKCGTATSYRYTVYLATGGTATVTEIKYVIAGIPTTSAIIGPAPDKWSGIATPYPLPVIAAIPYCTTVRVYE